MSEGDAGSGQGDSEGVVGLFQPITHPVLKSVDPVKVHAFLRDRERYETEIAEKKKEVPSLSKASYKVSVDSGLLKRMHFLGKFESFAPGKEYCNLTSTDIQKFVKSLVERKDESYDPTLIEKALKVLRIPTHIADPEARILEFASSFFERLESIGYDDFKEDNPKKTVKLLQEKLYPRKLKTVMQKALDYQESLQSDVSGYVRLLCSEAAAHDKYQMDTDSDKAGSSRGHRGRSDNKEKGNKDKGGSVKDKEDSPNTKSKYPHLCLNEECAEKGLRHPVMRCNKTRRERSIELLEKHKKQLEDKRKVGQVSDSVGEGTEKSTLINASFANVLLRIICTDIGSDINLMGPDLLTDLLEKGAKVSVREYSTPRNFNLAILKGQNGEDIYVQCDKEVTLNVELFVRHGCYLELRNMTWYVATTDVGEPLLGRPVLEALGINTKELLVAAIDRMGHSIDIGSLVPIEDYPEGSVARLMHQGIFHSNGGYVADQGDKEDDTWLDLGEDTEAEVDEALEKLVQEAVDNGISEKGQGRLRSMLDKYRGIFRLRLGNDPPADVDPMKIVLKPGAKPVRAKPRRYSTDGRKFMERYVQRIQEYGFGIVNTQAQWVAAPVLVTKPAPANFRLTFDYRPINAATEPVAWPMPHIDSELADLAGSKHFALIDFPSGYWQLPLDEDSQELLSFMTPTTVIQPKRCTQGAKNAGPNFQSKVEPLFAGIREFLKAWLDDFMLHNETEEGLLDALDKFFMVCLNRKLKISARKTHLFLLVVRWCGRIIDGNGVQFDPRNLSGLQEIHLPRTAGELCEYVHCLQWMSNGIPDFANRVAPLKQVLEEAYAISGSRTKKSIKSIQLTSLSWSVGHDELFRAFQEQLRETVKLSHRDSKKTLCVFTDASDAFWSGVVTQCEPGELDKEVNEQRHEPLAFLGAAFKGAEEWWTTFEKEAYAIYQVFQKMDYLFLCEQETHVHTDHRNLLFVFNPLALDSTLGRHVVHKVQRWGLFLSRFSYVIEHIEGTNNVIRQTL